MQIEELIRKIENRKVILDRKELYSWLFLYCLEYRKLCPKADFIRLTKLKLKALYEVADELYWKYDKPLEMEFDYRNIPKIAKEDYKNNFHQKRCI